MCTRIRSLLSLCGTFKGKLLASAVLLDLIQADNGRMMNNSWYEVKLEVYEEPENEEAYLLFRHPVEAGNGPNGWMKQPPEQKIEQVKREAAAPEKQFTRQEIEKHHTEDDCWIVVGGNVYDATSVLSWHPGGKGPVLAHAGAVHLETSEEFEGIHDDFARDKLKGRSLPHPL